MHFLLTGHTGFKGSWLTLLLTELGHTVSGVALDPEPLSLFQVTGLQTRLNHDFRADIRDPGTMEAVISVSEPDVLVHMAAQSLVRESYAQPRRTIETNVMGTLCVLESALSYGRLKALLIVTTDKVYRNTGKRRGYVEDDSLGGDDPYSASKAMADLLTQSWLASFPGPPTAIVRAGNVIGGGDYGKDRLMPDLMTALSRSEKVQLRYPDSVRPWQHVLDCLTGYMMVARSAIRSGDPDCGSWNIGPEASSLVSVAEVSSLVGELWGVSSAWEVASGEHPVEADVLTLDARRAHSELGWRGLLDFAEAVEWTTHWYKDVASGADPLPVTLNQIDAFLERAATGNMLVNFAERF